MTWTQIEFKTAECSAIFINLLIWLQDIFTNEIYMQHSLNSPTPLFSCQPLLSGFPLVGVLGRSPTTKINLCSPYATLHYFAPKILILQFHAVFGYFGRSPTIRP